MQSFIFMFIPFNWPQTWHVDMQFGHVSFRKAVQNQAVVLSLQITGPTSLPTRLPVLALFSCNSSDPPNVKFLVPHLWHILDTAPDRALVVQLETTFTTKLLSKFIYQSEASISHMHTSQQNYLWTIFFPHMGAAILFRDVTANPALDLLPVLKGIPLIRGRPGAKFTHDALRQLAAPPRGRLERQPDSL